MSQKKKKIIILYHGHCPDGFGGAWAAWKKFGDRAEYIPLHRQDVPPVLKNRELYFIDFVYTKEVMHKYMKENLRVTAIDHHVTAEAVTKSTMQPLYALHHSGAILAWMYFHPQKSTPKMLKHIEDVDLWKFKLKGTREISAQLELIPLRFKNWSVFAKNLEETKKRAQIINGGKLLLTYKNKLVERIARNAESATFAGHNVLVLNSPEFQSELGHVLGERSGIGVIWSEVGGMIRVSLRSDGRVNVAKIAERYGGGGHKAAAGFLLGKGKSFPWKTKN